MGATYQDTKRHTRETAEDTDESHLGPQRLLEATEKPSVSTLERISINIHWLHRWETETQKERTQGSKGAPNRKLPLPRNLQGPILPRIRSLRTTAPWSPAPGYERLLCPHWTESLTCPRPPPLSHAEKVCPQAPPCANLPSMPTRPELRKTQDGAGATWTFLCDLT